MDHNLSGYIQYLTWNKGHCKSPARGVGVLSDESIGEVFRFADEVGWREEQNTDGNETIYLTYRVDTVVGRLSLGDDTVVCGRTFVV